MISSKLKLRTQLWDKKKKEIKVVSSLHFASFPLSAFTMKHATSLTNDAKVFSLCYSERAKGESTEQQKKSTNREEKKKNKKTVKLFLMIAISNLCGRLFFSLSFYLFAVKGDAFYDESINLRWCDRASSVIYLISPLRCKLTRPHTRRWEEERRERKKDERWVKEKRRDRDAVNSVHHFCAMHSCMTSKKRSICLSQRSFIRDANMSDLC